MSDAGGSKGAKKVGGSNKVGIKPEPASTQAGVQKKKAAPKSKATENASAAVAAAAAAAVEDEEAGREVSVCVRDMFSKELAVLMYGFGDAEVPVKESVELMEDILAEYVAEMTRGAMDAAWRRDMLKLELHAAFPPEAADKPNKQMAALAAAAAANAAAGKVKIDEKDIMLLVRKDARKYARIRELLTMQQIIQQAKRAVEEESGLGPDDGQR